MRHKLCLWFKLFSGKIEMWILNMLFSEVWKRGYSMDTDYSCHWPGHSVLSSILPYPCISLPSSTSISILIHNSFCSEAFSSYFHLCSFSTAYFFTFSLPLSKSLFQLRPCFFLFFFLCFLSFFFLFFNSFMHLHALLPAALFVPLWLCNLFR